MTDLALDERPCDACDKGAAHIRFHPKYPTHTYSVCDEHDNDETINRLVAEYEAYMA